MTYSEENTLSHPLATRYLKLLDTVLKNEGARRTPFTTEKGIDLDQYEIDKNRGQDRDNTMDFMIGLSNNQLLLVEAKLRVKSPQNLSEDELKTKLIHSKDVLVEFGQTIAKEKVFLFDNSVIGRARYHVSKLFKNNPNLKVHTIDEFKEEYFTHKN